MNWQIKLEALFQAQSGNKEDKEAFVAFLSDLQASDEDKMTIVEQLYASHESGYAAGCSNINYTMR